MIPAHVAAFSTFAAIFAVLRSPRRPSVIDGRTQQSFGQFSTGRNIVRTKTAGEDHRRVASARRCDGWLNTGLRKRRTAAVGYMTLLRRRNGRVPYRQCGAPHGKMQARIHIIAMMDLHADLPIRQNHCCKRSYTSALVCSPARELPIEPANQRYN